MIFIRHDELEKRIELMAIQILDDQGQTQEGRAPLGIYPVPRGGIPIAYLLLKFIPWATILSTPFESDDMPVIIVDDIVDSGTTQKRFPNFNFYAPFDKRKEIINDWIVFPWEIDTKGSIEDNIVRILEFIGEDPTREGLLETPQRVVNSWQELYSGYSLDAKDCFKIFDVKHDELVLMQDIELYSTCEHHMLPFVGRAHIAYIADGRVIGASKLARILEVYSRRLQVQERLGCQVVDALMEHLKPKGAACIIEARHFCMCSRGINKQHSLMKTSAMRGIFLEDSDKGRAARAELMSLLK